MRVTIKKCSYPSEHTDGWYDKFYIWIKGRAVATCDTREDAELVRDALKEYTQAQE